MSSVCYQTEPGSAHLLSSDWLLVRSQGDFQESSSSTFWFQPVSGLRACCHHVVTILHLAGGLVSAKQLKNMHQIVIYNLSEGTRIPVSILPLNYCSNCHYCFYLTAFPFFLYSLTSLVSNYLNLFFGAQGRPRKLKSFSMYRKQGGLPWWHSG